MTQLSVYAAIYRLLNALCQICAFALDLQGYPKEFMFGSSWAVSLDQCLPGNMSWWYFSENRNQFTAAGPVFVLPIIKFWLKDTNMQPDMEVDDGVVGREEQHNTLGSAPEVIEEKY